MEQENSPTFNLLLVDDEDAIRSSLKRVFNKDPFVVSTAKNGDEALMLMDQLRIDAAIVDLKMPGMDGITLLRHIRERSVLTKVIMLTGRGGIKEAVEAIAIGAIDFLEKPFSADMLRQRILQLFEEWKVNYLRSKRENDINRTFVFPDLIGHSPAMMELKQLIAQVGGSDASVLIQGESGTGKELVATAIHLHSDRRENKLIPVDCASLGESLIQSELFGHTKGAFTGASTSSSGLIRAADKGTLFLDEIGELDLALQTRFLRTIQERMVRPVGSTQAFEVDVRIIAATNRRLEQEVAAGRFREDLYYRINTVLIELPPLRERIQDIPLLVDYLISRFRKESSRAKTVNPDAMLCLQSYHWPGNIRELTNVITRATILCQGNEITPGTLPAEICGALEERKQSGEQTKGVKLEDYEKLAIINALEKGGQNRRSAAQILGIGEATLYRKLKKYGL